MPVPDLQGGFLDSAALGIGEIVLRGEFALDAGHGDFRAVGGSGDVQGDRDRVLAEVDELEDDGAAVGGLVEDGSGVAVGGEFAEPGEVERGALDDAAAGEAENFRLEVGDGLRQVVAEAVCAALPGVFGEEGDVVEVDRALVPVQEQAELAARLGTDGLDVELVFLPFAGIDGERRAGFHRAVLADERGIEFDRLGCAGGEAGHEREMIGLALLERKTAESGVVKRGPAVAMGFGCHAGVMRYCGGRGRRLRDP